MAVSASDIAFVEELFAPLGRIAHRKTTGGSPVRLGGRIFSIPGSDGTVFPKDRGAFAEPLTDEGCRQFADPDGRRMGNRTIPDEAPDDPETARARGRRAPENSRAATKHAIGARGHPG